MLREMNRFKIKEFKLLLPYFIFFLLFRVEDPVIKMQAWDSDLIPDT